MRWHPGVCKKKNPTCFCGHVISFPRVSFHKCFIPVLQLQSLYAERFTTLSKSILSKRICYHYGNEYHSGKLTTHGQDKKSREKSQNLAAGNIIYT